MPLGRSEGTPQADLALNSTEMIMRDVNYGWLLRYLHSNGASLFFFAVYIHIFRGLYYGSYKAPRELLWMLSEIGDDQAVAPMAELLKHDELREDARMALERIPGEASLLALEGALKSAPADFKTNLAQ